MADGEKQGQDGHSASRSFLHGALSVLARRAVLIQTILILLLVWSYAAWRIRSDQAETLDAARHELSAIAAGMYVHMQAVLNDSLGAARAAVLSISALGGVDSVDAAPATERLSRQLSSGEYVRALFIATPSRFLGAARDGQTRSLDTLPQWLRPALLEDARVYIGTAIADPVAPSRHAFPIAVRIDDASGTPVWAGALLGIEWLDQLYESMSIRDGALSLVSARGDLLLRVPAAGESKRPINIAGTLLFRRGAELPREGGIIEGPSAVAPGTWVHAVRGLSGYRLAVAASREKGAILAPWRNRTRSLIYVLAGVSILFLALTVLLRHFVRRVERVNTNLAQLNAELETRVAARTTELQQANRQLELTNQELEAFTASASHDLRSPLGTIAGQAGLLLDELQSSPNSPMTDSIRQRIDRIQSGVARSAEIIDGLLTLARTSRQELLNERVDLSALAHSIVEDLRQQYPGHAVDCAIQPNLIVNADPRLMKSLLGNLLGNAWKYTAGTPNARVELSRAPGQGASVFSVRDNGAGFDVANAGRIFEPFQRLHAASEFPGVGIGLATVSRIVQRYFGRIAVDSEPGRGATFRFTLPAAEPAAPQ